VETGFDAWYLHIQVGGKSIRVNKKIDFHFYKVNKELRVHVEVDLMHCKAKDRHLSSTLYAITHLKKKYGHLKVAYTFIKKSVYPICFSL
jgi:hypothetical protein